MRTLLMSLLVTLVCAAPARAGEGLWQPAQLPALAEALQSRYPHLKPQALVDPAGDVLGAVVDLDGCSGAFVSADGLVLSSRDCIEGALRTRADATHDWVADGFLAAGPARALRLPGVHAFVTLKSSDITEKLLSGLHPWLTGGERRAKIAKAKKHLLAACESDGVRCRVHALHGGLRYRLDRQREIDDLRLVYAPPRAIAAFGGRVDAWSWPRQSADFVLLRAFTTSPDGASAVAYHPAQVLAINPEGMQAGDFVVSAGFPRASQREALASELHATINWRDPRIIEVAEARLAIIDKAVSADSSLATKYAPMQARLRRAVGHARAELLALRRAHAIDRRRARESALEVWLKQPGAATRQQRSAIGQLRTAITSAAQSRERAFSLGLMMQSAMLSAALDLVHLAAARGKQDAKRDVGFQQRDWPRLKHRMAYLNGHFDPALDQRLLAYALVRYVALPPDQHLKALDQWLDKAHSPKQISAKVKRLYAGSKLARRDARMALFKADAKAIDASHDRLIVLARTLLPALRDIRSDAAADAGKVAKFRVQVMRAVVAWRRASKQPVYADANGSLRLGFGTVRGVAPRDGERYAAFSTVRGIVDKATGVAPWDAPQAELDAIKAAAFDGYAADKLGTLPVNFIADLDTLAGEQGGPVLDADGRLVGLITRPTRDGAARQWLYDPRTQRSVQVDVRAILWVLHRLAHADRLLTEMGVDASDSRP